MRLTVLYDPRCATCRRFSRVLAFEEQLVPVELLSTRTAVAKERYAGLVNTAAPHHALTTISDAGGVWRGANAWRMALWGLARHRFDAKRDAAFRPPHFVDGHPAEALSDARPSLASSVVGSVAAFLGMVVVFGAVGYALLLTYAGAEGPQEVWVRTVGLAIVGLVVVGLLRPSFHPAPPLSPDRRQT